MEGILRPVNLSYVEKQFQKIILNNKANIYAKPWPNDSKCSKFFTRFGKNIPLTFLISYPRSGNTWLRYLIEGSSGIFTGSSYFDYKIFRMGYIGEKASFKSNRIIVVKSHEESIFTIKPRSSEKDRAIVLIRNLQMSILSYWSFKTQQNFFSSANLKSYTSNEFHEFVMEGINSWRVVYLKHLKIHKNTLVVFYENLLRDPLHELHRVLSFLGVNASQERLRCVRKHVDGPVKRKNFIKDPFTEAEKRAMSQALQDVYKILESKNISNIPEEYSSCCNASTNSLQISSS